MTRHILAVLALAVFLLGAGVAWAVDLQTAKAEGLVGEQADGYLGAVAAKPRPDVAALVAEINRKRRAQYERIALQNDVDITDVELLAGQKAIDKTEDGQYINPTGSGWERK